MMSGLKSNEIAYFAGRGVPAVLFLDKIMLLYLASIE